MRLVFDSSVWIAAIGSETGFASAAILYAYKTADISIFISDQILDEIKSNLIKKLKFDEPSALKAQIVVNDLCGFKIIIAEDDEREIKEIRYRKDRHLLALCKKVQADYLITFDRKHLLPLKKFQKTEILEPKTFLTMMQKNK